MTPQERWRVSNPEKAREASRVWRVNNPEKVKEKKLDYRLRMRSLVDQLKNAPCTDCGHEFPPECMDWDHVRGKKLERVSHFLESGKQILLAEIAKCELVCSNCHRTRTRKRSAD